MPARIRFAATLKGRTALLLGDCMLDISLVKQNAEYDLLLDEDRGAMQMVKGEIAIAVARYASVFTPALSKNHPYRTT